MTKTDRRPRPVQLFRYPGGKGKIADDIFRWMPPRIAFAGLMGQLRVFCEPFVGSGAILAKMLPDLPRSARLVLGDADPGVTAAWRAVVEQPGELCRRIFNYTPTVEDFYRFKELDGKPDDDFVSVGFRKLALHQMSFSGLGAKAGGPIGGRGQRSDYNVHCRYKKERHAKNVAALSHLFRQFAGVEVRHGLVSDTLATLPDDPTTVVYLDPPYYQQGGALYVHNMDDAMHASLAAQLRASRFDWWLSYDDHPRVRELYQEWADIKSFEMTATIETQKGKGARRKNNELVICPRGAF